MFINKDTFIGDVCPMQISIRISIEMHFQTGVNSPRDEKYPKNVPRDVFFYRRLLGWHHRNWTIRRQPIRTIIATSVMTNTVDVAN